MTYRILDLFCGAGGAAVGYERAGFEVVGIDVANQPNYPFELYCDNALSPESFDYAVNYFDAIHASPPCQAYSAMSACRPGLSDQYPKLIEPTREFCEATGLPYVIENVPGAPLKDPLTLCGTQFDRTVEFNGRTFELQRHRLFETSWAIEPLFPCTHIHRSFPVYGHSAPGNRPDLRGKGFAAASKRVMGIDWMSRNERAESIPPCYTEYIGTELRKHLMSTSNQEVA